MKIRNGFKSGGFPVLTAAVLAWSAGLVSAQDYVVNTFDDDTQASTWSRWWGAAPQLYEFDYTVDAAAKASSGSLKVTVDFDLAAYGGDNQFAAQTGFGDAANLDGTKYTNLVFDIRWDPSSPKTASGDFGYLEYGFRNSDWSQTWLGGKSIAASSAGQWVRVTAPINPTTAKLDTITGVVLKLWSGGAGGLNGQTVFWLDNVKLIASPNAVLPPPVMAIQSAKPGLQLSASAPGQQYQRQSIRTLTADADGNPISYSWVGSTTPVTYSMTIKEFPDAAHSGFQAHIFLVPESSMPNGAGDTSIDWNAGEVVFIQIGNNADGTASGNFRYKINQPGGNSMLWNADPAAGPAGALANVSSPSALGTWSVTFKNNTDGTITAPSGASADFSMLASAAAMFANPVVAYFGIQPNQPGNVGQSAVLSRVQISGVAVPLTDDFSGTTLDAAKLQVVAADATGVVLVPPNSAYWLKWTAPATGYVLQASPDLKTGSWVDLAPASVIQVGGEKMTLLPSSGLPGTKSGFFRLFKP